MKCPACNSSDVYIVETRKKIAGEVRRRRCCMPCGYRWTTSEVRVEELERLRVAAHELACLQAMVRRCV